MITRRETIRRMGLSSGGLALAPFFRQLQAQAAGASKANANAPAISTLLPPCRTAIKGKAAAIPTIEVLAPVLINKPRDKYRTTMPTAVHLLDCHNRLKDIIAAIAAKRPTPVLLMYPEVVTNQLPALSHCSRVHGLIRLEPKSR